MRSTPILIFVEKGGVVELLFVGFGAVSNTLPLETAAEKQKGLGRDLSHFLFQTML